MHEDEVQKEDMQDTPLVDIKVQPALEPKSKTGRLIVGGIAVVAALVLGSFAIANLSDDGSEVTAAEANDDQAVEDDSSGAEDEAADRGDSEASAAAVDAIAADGVDFATASAVGFGFGPGGVLFADGEFVSLGHGPNGITISRSADGTEWASADTVGLPEGASAYHLAQTDDGWVTVVEVWPVFDEEDEASFYFGPSEQPERFLGFSEDLVNWTTSELPEIDADENEWVNVNSIAAVGNQVALLIQVDPGGPDEFGILFENGHLTEDTVESYCGGGFEGDDYVGYTCDYEYEAMEDEGGVTTTTIDPADEFIEPADEVGDAEFAVEEAVEVEEEELLRVSPGDPGYDELFEAFNSFNDFVMPNPIVAAGQVGGAFTVTDLPATGYNSGLVSTDQGFVAQVHNYDEGGAVILASADGISWAQTGSLAIEGSVDSLVVSGNRILASGQIFDDASQNSNLVTWISDDQGATWTEAIVDTALFGPYGNAIAGPAGFALKLGGSTEPYEDFPDPFADAEPVSVVVDGYTLTVNLSDGTSTLTGPDGAVIYENVSDEDIYTGQVEGIVRFEGRFMETAIWLDPETGEDLVSIPGDLIGEAVEEIFRSFEEGPGADFVEPPQGSEIWFSADGLSWTLLQSDVTDFEGGGYTGLAGVGDDEVLLRTDNYVEPPEELLAFDIEGREPTDAELDALNAWDLEQSGVEWIVIPVG